MNFDFLPYKLNTPLKDLIDKLVFEGSENDIYQYNIVPRYINDILGNPIDSISLYFYRNRLITAFCQTRLKYCQWEKAVKQFEAYFKTHSMCWEEDEGYLYHWQRGNQFLGILADKENNCIKFYHTIKRYNVFES
ncbi:MAG: hypothetical protein QM727_12515 [Niabella sp.]